MVGWIRQTKVLAPGLASAAILMTAVWPPANTPVLKYAWPARGVGGATGGTAWSLMQGPQTTGLAPPLLPGRTGDGWLDRSGLMPKVTVCGACDGFWNRTVSPGWTFASAG